MTSHCDIVRSIVYFPGSFAGAVASVASQPLIAEPFYENISATLGREAPPTLSSLI